MTHTFIFRIVTHTFIFRIMAHKFIRFKTNSNMFISCSVLQGKEIKVSFFLLAPYPFLL